MIAPNDSLVIHRYNTIRAVYMAGDLRNCHRGDLVIAVESPHPVVRLVVKRNQEIL